MGSDRLGVRVRVRVRYVRLVLLTQLFLCRMSGKLNLPQSTFWRIVRMRVPG